MALDYWDYAALGLEPPAERPAPPPAEPAPLSDDRTLFARVNDWMIDTGNAAASLAQAGASFFAPDTGAAKSVGDFIEEGRNNQSDYRKKLRDEQQRLIEEAKAKGDTGALAWITHALSNPITELLPEAVGNIGPFAAVGKVAQGATAATALARGAGAAEAAAAGTKGGLLATEAMGGLVGAGGVRQGYYEDIQKAPDAQLQAENPTYAQLRQSMSEADAKRQLGAEMNPRLAAGMAAGGGVGMLAGRFGAEEAILGKTPGFARIAGAEVGTEFAEGAIQQGAQNFAVQGQLPSKSLWEDVLLSGVQEATVAAPGGVAGGILGRKRAEVEKTIEDLKAITEAPTIEDAVAAAARAIDPALKTAADTPQQTSRMTDDALLSAQARFEQEAAAAQAIMREQAFAAARPPEPAAPQQVFDDRQAQVAAQDQATRDAGIQAMNAQQTQEAIVAPRQEGPVTPLATGVAQAPAMEGPMQAAFNRAKARLEERRATTVQEPERTVQSGAPAALAAPGVQTTGAQATVLASPTAPAPSSRNIERDGQLADAPTRLERPADVGPPARPAVPQPADRPAAAAADVVAPGRGDNRGVDAPVPEPGTGQPAAAPVAAGVRPDVGADAVAKLNASLAAERKQRGETSTQPSVVAFDEEALPATRRKNPDGTQTLSKHEAQTVRRFAEIFGKDVAFFRAANETGRFDGAVVNGGKTIYLNVDAKSAHHLVIAGHELGHQMRKDAPDLYDQLKRRLSTDLKPGNLGNFARYYGTSNEDVYRKLRDASERDAVVEEFISDLIGNRSAEYKTMLDIFGAAKGSKDAGLIYKVAQFLVDFIDGLIARINRSKFETDALVKDLDKVRREVRGALKEYAVRQSQATPTKYTKPDGRGGNVEREAPRDEAIKELRMQASLLRQLQKCLA